MKRLERPSLSMASLTFLGKRTARVCAAADAAAEADRLWRYQRPKAMREVRAALERMASGRMRCMYCEDGAGDTTDHFRPRARWPLHAFVWANLLLACGRCNITKRDRFPVDEAGLPLLVDPSAEDPWEHLRLIPSTGRFSARTQRGEACIELFDLNDDVSPRRLPAGRADAVRFFLESIDAFVRAVADGDVQAQDDHRERVRRLSFAGALHFVIQDCLRNPGAGEVYGEDRVRAIREFGIAAWVSPP